MTACEEIQAAQAQGFSATSDYAQIGTDGTRHPTSFAFHPCSIHTMNPTSASSPIPRMPSPLICSLGNS